MVMDAEPSSPPTSGATVGVIGLGDIGSGVAAGLVRAGVDLVVCDIRPESTAPFADTARVASDPAELAALVDVVVVAVVTDEQVLAVLDGATGALAGARPGLTVVIVSTVAPRTVARVAELAGARGVSVADCGVSGGPSSAAEGALISMIGGDDDVVERIRPVLNAFSSLVVRMGPLGSGLQAKLARNLVQYASWLAAYEAQVLAEAAGIELSKLAQVIKASDARIGGASTLMFRRTVAPFTSEDDAGLVGAMRTAAGLAHKDLRGAMELGDLLGVELPLAAMTDARADALFGIGPDVTRARSGTGG
jgi:3-hydroxyisobutyrate dehydrogenase-like beta-hydroxyacid dehydrogenase